MYSSNAIVSNLTVTLGFLVLYSAAMSFSNFNCASLPVQVVKRRVTGSLLVSRVAGGVAVMT